MWFFIVNRAKSLVATFALLMLLGYFTPVNAQPQIADGVTAVAMDVQVSSTQQDVENDAFSSEMPYFPIFFPGEYDVFDAMPLVHPIVVVLDLNVQDANDKQTRSWTTSTAWYYAKAWQVWTYWDWSWRDNWFGRDFHVNFRVPQNAGVAKFVFYTNRAYNVFRNAQLVKWSDGTYRHGDLTAGAYARGYGYYYYWDDASAWANEMRVTYQR